MILADQIVLKANEEMRYTLGVLYPPDMIDLHGEYATDTELHKAVIAYGLQPDKRLRLQHNEAKEVGTVVELMRWPYPVETEMISSTGLRKSVTLPAGTSFAGVIWDPEYWASHVKTGRIRGYSMGGRAMRVREARAPKTVKKASCGSLMQRVAREGSVRLT